MKCESCKREERIVYKNDVTGHLCAQCYSRYKSVFDSVEFKRACNGWKQLMAMENLSKAFENAMNDMRIESTLSALPMIAIRVIDKATADNYAMIKYKTNVMNNRGEIERYDEGVAKYLVTAHGVFNKCKNRYISVEYVDGSGNVRKNYYYPNGKVIHRTKYEKDRRI